MGYLKPSLTSDDLDLMQNMAAIQARRSFWAFRQFMHPNLKKSWWQKDAAHKLQQFYEDLIAGRRPKLLFQAPPQHGKSMMIVDFIAWISGKSPDIKTIYAAFSGRLGTRANQALQRIWDGARFQMVFPELVIPPRNGGAAGEGFQRNSEIIEFVNLDGMFRNTTVRGAITGEGLDLGVIDDPIKGREEAQSQIIRDKTYDWLTDDFMTRFSDSAGLLGIMTRWNLDDLFGRMVDEDKRIISIKYPAIALPGDPHRPEGEPLFPEHKSIEFLMERKRMMGAANWEALYQQNPIVSGGNLFKDDWWGYYRSPPVFEWRMLYGDTAMKTKEHNDFSVLQCWGKSRFGQAVLIDQIRGKWESPELKVQARAFWNKHKESNATGTLRGFKVEDKASGTGLIQELKREGIPIIGIQRATDKVSRANDAAPFIESGNVLLPEEASWLSDFLAEAAAFPNGAHDDQLDPMMDAVTDILTDKSTFANIRAL